MEAAQKLRQKHEDLQDRVRSTKKRKIHPEITERQHEDLQRIAKELDISLNEVFSNAVDFYADEMLDGAMDVMVQFLRSRGRVVTDKDKHESG